MSTQSRKYPRVFLTKGIREFDKIIGVEVKLENGIQTGVLDISYVGAALVKSSRDTSIYEKGQKLKLSFHFADVKAQVVLAEVVRADEKVIAVYFPEMEISARMALQKFLKEKLIGLNTHLVSPEFYIKEQKFDYWFHGPNETNIFVWGTKDKDKYEIQKVTLEIDRKVLTWEKGLLYLSKTKDYLSAPTEDYAYQVNFPDDKKEISAQDPLLSTVLSLLSQIQDDTGVITAASEKVLSVKK